MKSKTTKKLTTKNIAIEHNIFLNSPVNQRKFHCRFYLNRIDLFRKLLFPLTSLSRTIFSVLINLSVLKWHCITLKKELRNQKGSITLCKLHNNVIYRHRLRQ